MYSKKSWQGAHFLEHWLLGSGARKPRRKPEGSALKPLPSTFCGVLRLTNQFIQNHQKASVKSIAVWKGKFISYLGKVCVCVCFLPTLFHKNRRHLHCCDEKHGEQLNINLLRPLEKHTHFGSKKHTTQPYKKKFKGMQFPSKGHICLRMKFNLKHHVSFESPLKYSCESTCRELRSMLPNTYKEPYAHAQPYIYIYIHATLFKNMYMSKCCFLNTPGTSESKYRSTTGFAA